MLLKLAMMGAFAILGPAVLLHRGDAWEIFVRLREVTSVLSLSLFGVFVGSFFAFATCLRRTGTSSHNGDYKASWEVNLMRWLQACSCNSTSPSSTFPIRVASFCRYLVLDETIFLITPLLVWTFEERIMFVVFAISLNEIVNGILKWCFQRPRPYWVEPRIANPIKKQEIDFSFPSSHAQTSSSFITAIVLEFGVNTVTAMLMALTAAVCISRVILGVHYPTCVAAGAALGILFTLALDRSCILDWYVSDLDFQSQLLAVVALGLLILFAFKAAQDAFPLDHDLIAAYRKKLGLKESAELKVRSLEKYSFPVLSLLGSGVGCAFAIKDKKNLLFSFPVTDLTWTEIKASQHLVARVILIGLPVTAFLFSTVFVLPGFIAAKVSQNLRRSTKTLGIILKLTGSFLIGFWITYLCPRTTSFLGLEESFVNCPDNWTQESIAAENMYVDYTWQMRGRNKCHIRPYNHTAANPRLQLASIKVETLGQLLELVSSIREEHKVLRFVGAGWSTKGQFERNNNTVYAALVGPIFQGYQKVEPTAAKERPLVVVGAGIFIGGQKWLNEPDIVQWEDSLVHKLWQDGMALPNLPDAIGMTLGGLISTGSDGWGSALDPNMTSNLDVGGSLSSVLLGFRYVDGMGRLREAWRNDTTSRDFYSFGVSLGLAGVLYEVVLAPVDAFCVGLSLGTHKGNACSIEIKKSAWYGTLRTGVDTYDLVDVVHRKVTKPLGVSETGEVLCGNRTPLHSLKRAYEDSDFPILFFGYPYSLTEADFLTNMIWLAVTWVNQDSCQVKSDFCADHEAYLALGGGRLPDPLDDRHKRVFDSCSRALLQLKKLKTKGNRPKTHKEWWTKDMITTCFGVVMETFGIPIGKEETGIYRYYESAFLHRLTAFHSFHNMEIYFPLEKNKFGVEEIICYVRAIYEEEGHDKVGQQFDYYISKVTDGFWMSPEQGKLSHDKGSTTMQQTKEVLRLNFYLPWVVEDFYPAFEVFLDRFNALGITYTLNWGKILPRKRMHMSRVLENYPYLEDWKAFVSENDPDGVFLSNYWRNVFMF